MFKLYVELENNELDFKPKKEDLQELIKTTMASMHDLLKDFRRIENTMYEEGKKRLDDMMKIREKEIKNNPSLARKQVEYCLFDEPETKENFFEK